MDLSLSLKHRLKSHIVITKGCGNVGLDAGWHWLAEELGYKGIS